MTYFWETVDTIASGLGWPHFGPFHLAVLAVFLLLGAVLCRGYCGMDTDKRRRWRRMVALLLVADELFKDFGLLYGGNFSLDYLPLHLCSINIFLIALHAWRRPKLLDTFLYFVCLPAACAALLFPTWASLPPLNFMVFHSFTVHFLLALYPLALTLRGDMDPQPRAFRAALPCSRRWLCRSGFSTARSAQTSCSSCAPARATPSSSSSASAAICSATLCSSPWCSP